MSGEEERWRKDRVDMCMALGSVAESSNPSHEPLMQRSKGTS